MNTTMPTKSHNFATLAKRISAWTTNSLLTLLILVTGVGFGRQTLKWWAADASASSIPGDRLCAPSPFQTLQFGDNVWSLRRRSVVGDKKRVSEQLRAACREMLGREPLVDHSYSSLVPKGEGKLDFLAGLTPVDHKTGKWRLYELHDAFPMAVGVATKPNSKEDHAVVWGLALPVGDRQWTLSTFQMGISTSEGAFDKREVPLPHGGRQTLAMSASDGRIVAFSGPNRPEDWKKFYDNWFSHQGYQPTTWRQVGSAWYAKFLGHGDSVDVRFGPNERGDLSGLWMMTPQQLR